MTKAITKDTLQKIFDDLLELNKPFTADELGIYSVTFKPCLEMLFTRDSKQILALHLVAFINTLGKNKSGGNNAISRFQYFLNAYIQESLAIKANPDRLAFIGGDHHSLVRGHKGTNDADFYFYASNGKTYTIDAKIFFSEESYYKLKEKDGINFHNADYGLVYLIKSKNWVVCRKTDNYAILQTRAALAGEDAYLSELSLPALTLIRFYSPQHSSSEFSKLCDSQVLKLEEINYEFYI